MITDTPVHSVLRFRFHASYVIMAIPPSQASRIHYTPPLPAAKDQLLKGMLMGPAIKTVTLYSRPWWREKGLTGNLACSTHNHIDTPIVVTLGTIHSPSPGYNTRTLTHSPPTPDTTDRDEEGGALAGFIIGDDAVHWAKKSTEERKEAVLKQYERQFGCKEALEAIDYVDKIWMDEEYCRGCVSYCPPGVFSLYGDQIRNPIGRIHWAGTLFLSFQSNLIQIFFRNRDSNRVKRNSSLLSVAKD